jgi:hypothetical protein
MIAARQNIPDRAHGQIKPVLLFQRGGLGVNERGRFLATKINAAP